MNNYTNIYIVRHGESEANISDTYGLDTRLTDKGKNQAQETAMALQDVAFDAVFSSPLVRAKETAEIIAAERNLEITTNKALRERDAGVFEGRKGEDVRKEFEEIYKLREQLPYDEWKTKTITEGYETDENMMSRFITALREIAIGYPGKNILITSHVAVMKALLIHLGYGTYKTLPGKAIRNAGYIKLRTDGVDFFIDELNGVIQKDAINE